MNISFHLNLSGANTAHIHIDLLAVGVLPVVPGKVGAWHGSSQGRGCQKLILLGMDQKPGVEGSTSPAASVRPGDVCHQHHQHCDETRSSKPSPQDGPLVRLCLRGELRILV